MPGSNGNGIRKGSKERGDSEDNDEDNDKRRGGGGGTYFVWNSGLRSRNRKGLEFERTWKKRKSINDEIDEKRLLRLKSACDLALRRFEHPLSIPLNNNVKKNPELYSQNSHFVFKTRRRKRRIPLIYNGVVRNGIGHSTTSSLNLYKFLNVLLSTFSMFLKVVLVSALFLFGLYSLMVLHKPTQTFVSRHTQDWIFPFMRTVRFAALPFITRFPQFHELYEDACVLSNPFFEMHDISCWPCESIRQVIDLTGFSNFTSGYYHSGVPFIVKDAFSHPVTFEDIQKLYQMEDSLSGSNLLRSSHPSILKTFEDVLTHKYSELQRMEELQIAWKINRAQYARLMRTHFSRPYYIPNSTEISVQHFLFVDGPLADQYSFPVTEFANVFVMQAEGRRLIVMVPVKHCRAACKAISVVLQPKDVLFYNWLFWQPISFPITSLQSDSNEGTVGIDGTRLSVTYVGSFY